MENTIKKFSLLLFATMILLACNKQPTVQEYYVEKQGNNNLMVIDLPASLLKVEDGASEETKKTRSQKRKEKLKGKCSIM